MFGWRRRRKQVARNLLLEEAIVRNIAIEGVDDVVAIAPRVGIGHVARGSGGLGVARDVEPVTAPALAILLARPAAIHEFGVSLLRVIF
jgi:hypothetical protein